MKKATFTPAQYHTHGITLTDLMHWSSQVRGVITRHYPFSHPLTKATINADEWGVFLIRSTLENLAYYEHPTQDFDRAFRAAAYQEYQAPPLIPGVHHDMAARFNDATDKFKPDYKKRKKPFITDWQLNCILYFWYHTIFVSTVIIEKALANPNDQVIFSDMIKGITNIIKAMRKTVRELEKVVAI